MPVVRLVPLTPELADELHAVLDDPALHSFVGGAPPSLQQWRDRVQRWQSGASPDGRERWLNWAIVADDGPVAPGREHGGRIVGHAQATVAQAPDGTATADLAWVVGSAHQGQGCATAAARLMVAELRAEGVARFSAHIHPEHVASQRVAAAAGLLDTGTVDADGEAVWSSEVNGTDHTPGPAQP